MSRTGRKPWEIPISYNEDRFPEQPSRTLDDEVGGSIKPDPDLVSSKLRQADEPKPAGNPEPHLGSKRAPSGYPRPNWRDGAGAMSNDDAPLNYSRGPHDGELDVDDRDELD